MLWKNNHQWIPFIAFAPTSVWLLFCLDGGYMFAKLQRLQNLCRPHWHPQRCCYPFCYFCPGIIRLRMPERKYFYFLCHVYCYYFVSVLFSLREWSIKLSLVEVLPNVFWISYSTPALQCLLPFLEASSCSRQHVFQAACNCCWNSHTLVKN